MDVEKFQKLVKIEKKFQAEFELPNGTLDLDLMYESLVTLTSTFFHLLETKGEKNITRGKFIKDLDELMEQMASMGNKKEFLKNLDKILKKD